MNRLKVKIFTHCTNDIKPYNEMQINEWLLNNPGVTIVHLLQSESMAALDADRVDRNLTITIFYTDADKAPEKGSGR